MDYSPDRMMGHAKQSTDSGQVPMRVGEQSAYSDRLYVSELGTWMKIPVHNVFPALGSTISCVVQIGPNKQMGGPYARRIVTAVEYAQAGRNRAVSEFPRKAVGLDLFPVVSTELPVSLPGLAPSPNPAGIRTWDDVDLFPKTINRWDKSSKGPAFFGAILPPSILESVCSGKEWRPATEAHSANEVGAILRWHSGLLSRLRVGLGDVNASSGLFYSIPPVADCKEVLAHSTKESP